MRQLHEKPVCTGFGFSPESGPIADSQFIAECPRPSNVLGRCSFAAEKFGIHEQSIKEYVNSPAGHFWQLHHFGVHVQDCSPGQVVNECNRDVMPTMVTP